MKLLGRALWLALGLVYRVFVYVLFGKWLPFPERDRRSSRRRSRALRREQRAISVLAPTPPATLSARAPLFSRPEPPFFDAPSLELAPELAARLEGEHWLARPRRPIAANARAPRESLRSVLGDRRALRDAIVLGAALSPPRARRR